MGIWALPLPRGAYAGGEGQAEARTRAPLTILHCEVLRRRSLPGLEEMPFPGLEREGPSG